MCWCMLEMPALGRLEQEAYEYKSSLDCIARSCLKIKQQKLFRMEGAGREGRGPSLLPEQSPNVLSALWRRLR